MKPLRSPRGNLFRKYLLLIMTLVGGALLASSLLNLYGSYQESKESLLRIQREKALAAASKIEDFIKGIERQVGVAAQSPWVVAGDLKEQSFEFRKLFRLAPAVTEMAQMDPAGKEQLRVSRMARDVIGSQADLSREPGFLEAKAGRTYFSPVQFHQDSEPYMTIAMSGGGANAGVIVAEVNLKLIWDAITQIKIGRAGHAYVVDSQGQLIAHPDISLVLKKTNFSSLPQVQGALASRPEQDRGGTVTAARNLQGAQILTAFAGIAPPGWWVFVEQPLQEAFEPLYAMLLQSGLLVAVSLALSAAGCLVLARRMVTPIRALQAGAARIGAGDLTHRIQVRTDDELEVLADEFNRTAARLQESYEGLEQKVEARTRELTEALDQLKALGEVGQAVNSTLDLQTVLTTIVAHAVELSGTNGGHIYEYDEAGEEFKLTATHGMEAELFETLRSAPIRLGEGIIGHAAAGRAPVQVPDLEADHRLVLPRTRPVLARLGHRAILAIPLLREDRIVGGLVVHRREPGTFSTEVVNLLQTFATQSVLAIQNAHLFREIEEKSRQLEVASRHKSAFLANMSHELRTPLNAIIGFTRLVLRKTEGQIPPLQRANLQNVLVSSEHLLNLINGLLDLSKIEAGRMDVHPVTFDLKDLIHGATTAIEPMVRTDRVRLVADIAPNLPSLHTDREKLKQIVLNLLSNAAKFTDEGEIRVSARLDNGLLKLAVSDTGIGMPKEALEYIFEEFRQVDMSSTRKYGGTGLGLAIIRRLARLLGGEIIAESELGKGSTFTLTLPVGAERAASPMVSA